MVNGTDLMDALASLEGIRRELDALQEQSRADNDRLNQTVQALAGAGRPVVGGLTSPEMPEDVWNYTAVPALRVTGSQKGCNGYYAREPFIVNSRPVNAKMSAPTRYISYTSYSIQIRRSWRITAWNDATFVDSYAYSYAHEVTSDSRTVPTTGWPDGVTVELL